MGKIVWRVSFIWDVHQRKQGPQDLSALVALDGNASQLQQFSALEGKLWSYAVYAKAIKEHITLTEITEVGFEVAQRIVGRARNLDVDRLLVRPTPQAPVDDNLADYS